MNVNMRLRAQKWAVVLTIFFGVPGLLIWIFMPYLDLSRAGYLASRHDYLLAVRVLDRATLFNPLFEPAYARRGLIYGRLGLRDKALADFASALRLSPDDWQVYNNRAWLEYETGNLDAALKDADAAVINHSESPYPFDTRGTILMAKKDNERALKDFDEAIGLNSTYGAAFFHRSQCHSMRGDKPDAQRDAQMASELGYQHD